MKKAVVAVAISGLLGSCAALQELSGGPVIVAREPIRLEGYATSYEGRCEGAAFAIRVREQGNVEREAIGVSSHLRADVGSFRATRRLLNSLPRRGAQPGSSCGAIPDWGASRCT